MNDDAVADEEIDLERAQRKISMASDMEAAMEDTAWLASHPTPWTWKLAFHGGWFFQLFDANGTPCLGDDLRGAGDAALLLTMVNR